MGLLDHRIRHSSHKDCRWHLNHSSIVNTKGIERRSGEIRWSRLGTHLGLHDSHFRRLLKGDDRLHKQGWKNQTQRVARL